MLWHDYEVIPMGIKKDEVFGIKIVNNQTITNDIDTITMYLGPKNQKLYYDFILKTKPKRVIFNPGTENDQLKELCEQNSISCVENCTLVMLHQGVY